MCVCVWPPALTQGQVEEVVCRELHPPLLSIAAKPPLPLLENTVFMSLPLIVFKLSPSAHLVTTPDRFHDVCNFRKISERVSVGAAAAAGVLTKTSS